ncbi:unnamed protein product [Medioppia subpectinata]|uniref:Amino acid transporter transmembrane domain-containing protein n=1 Tax=Medioppia subpectinata TaxID=1979941 RepID=A0A7R9Q5M8_9ACAR|nr:unnamed protein product [Medioppia subpectinata]CAG2113653.1 unnamed protein product [Medioppia subpectinata]
MDPKSSEGNDSNAYPTETSLHISTHDIKSESTRSQRRGLSVSFAEKTDTILDATRQAITESLKTMDATGKLGSIREEYYGTPDDMGAESTALLKQYRERHRTTRGAGRAVIPGRRGSYLEKSHGGATWVTGGFLLVSAALGAGILNYPVAYDRLGGIAQATLVQLAVLCLLSTTMLILVYCSNINHDNSYHEVLNSICGPRVKNMAALSILLSTFGICVTYYVIIGDQFDRIFATFFGDTFCRTLFMNRQFVIPVVAVVMIWPLCYFKNLEFLKHFNILGIIAMLYVVYLSVYEYFVLSPTHRPTIDNIPGPSMTTTSTGSANSVFTVLAAVPVVSLAYQTHELVVPVNAVLRERTLGNFSRAMALALTTLLVLYCLCGTFGYLTFGGQVSADIMQMYDASDPVVVIGILALVVKMITTYPQIVLCGRDTIYRLIVPNTHHSVNIQLANAESTGSGSSGQSSSPVTPNARQEMWYRVGITSVWNVLALILSVLTPNITIAIGFLGAIGACNSFIFPGICMICLSRRRLTCIPFSAKNKCSIALNDLYTNAESIELCKI